MSPEALPGTYANKKDAIIALRAFAKHTGHKLVVPNHGSQHITLRCKGFSTTGCNFKVCVNVPKGQGIWVLDHGKQTWQHTCSLAASAASSSSSSSPATGFFAPAPPGPAASLWTHSGADKQRTKSFKEEMIVSACRVVSKNYAGRTEREITSWR